MQGARFERAPFLCAPVWRSGQGEHRLNGNLEMTDTIWLVIGMAIGVVIGVAMGNVAVGIGAGAGIGIALMLAQSIRKQSNNPGKNEE
jgi:hypothetical protein